MARPEIQSRFNYKEPVPIPTLSTGIRPLDRAVGIGGLPVGKITELVGPNGGSITGGPTLLAARIAARAQKQQKTVVIVDMAHSFDPWQAERCGLIAPQLLLTRPDTVFDAVATLEQAGRSAQLVIIVLGIVSDLLSHIEPDLLNTLLRRIHNIVHTSSGAFLFSTIPVNKDPFSPENYPPGFQLARLASLRLWLQNESWSFAGGLPTAYKASLTVIKNNLALAGKGANLHIKLHR
jgi:recombination protein RecA